MRAANDRLAIEREVSDDLEKLVRSLSRDVGHIPATEISRIDPYLLVALQQGLITALRALELDSPTSKRRQLRIALEQMRQATRDLLEGIPVSEERSTKETVRWVVDVLDIPQSEVAVLLDIHPRKFQRWLSVNDPSEPHDEDALRIRLLARIANHLRHSFSGPGVAAWLERPHPELKGQAPKDLLGKRQSFEQLVSLAAAARSHSST